MRLLLFLIIPPTPHDHHQLIPSSQVIETLVHNHCRALSSFWEVISTRKRREMLFLNSTSSAAYYNNSRTQKAAFAKALSFEARIEQDRPLMKLLSTLLL